MLFNSTLKGIDHLLVGVKNLEDVRHQYLRLGFQLTPRGRHIGWGTANYCIMFPDDYLELIGIVDASQDTNGLDVFLEKGEGGLGFAFRSLDTKATANSLACLGVSLEGPNDLKRILELDQGDVMPAFELLRYGSEVTPGMGSFVCDHKTPEIVWQDKWLPHANGAKGIKRIVYAMANPSDVINKYARFFGADSIVVTDGCIDIQLHERNQTLRLIASDAVSHFYPSYNFLKKERDSYMVGFHLWSDSVKATQAYFDKYRVQYRIEGNQSLRLMESDTGGMVIAFDAVVCP
ncbi:VOC family protein [Kiloniella antarctica]|uniref:VOC family protein n=1 Tax=Kiloniella antarctica TaxID=1550907 RepID=A0ABW5BE84_9PROT